MPIFFGLLQHLSNMEKCIILLAFFTKKNFEIKKMKRLKLRLLIIAILTIALPCLFAHSLQAQVVVTVVSTDGNEHPITLDEGGEILINSESMVVYATTSSSYSYALDDVRKVLFSGEVGVREIESGTKITVYPNPAGERFTINGIWNGEVHDLRLFSMSGAEVLRQDYCDGDEVIISQLPQGTYLVRLDNSITKIVKK